ncbi:hypothetical protein FRC07_012410, partial [Ceratobasidium sp. 392]
ALDAFLPDVLPRSTVLHLYERLTTPRPQATMSNLVAIQSSSLALLKNYSSLTVLYLYRIILSVLTVRGGISLYLTKRGADYVTSALDSSNALSERSIESSGSTSRARLLGMKFHPEWRHCNCDVMRWYAEQSPTNRKFRMIEHHKDANGPFFHEFLLLKLIDGSLYRLERVGVGAHPEAIQLGCKANDVIQWFTTADYAKFADEHTSVLLAEVDLRSEYDILDVLAICYAIQKSKECKVYTLQRYNCYFLCLTVLGVLTRRAAGWETELHRYEPKS